VFDPKTIQIIEEAMQTGNYPVALDALNQLQKNRPGEPLLMNKTGHVLLRMGELDRARNCFLAAKNALEDALIPVFSGLAELESRDGDFRKASDYGARSLALKSAQSIRNKSAFEPPTWKPSSKGRKRIISYSLYGAEPKYTEGAIANAEAARLFFPDFICRFHIDESVPAGVQKRLIQLKAEVVEISGPVRKWHPTMWRFLALVDPATSVVMLRDADSAFSDREQSMVAAWLESGKIAHVIRDWYAHTPLILSGLFGIQKGHFSGISNSIDAYLKRHPKHWGVDQAYLGDVIWPVIHDKVLVHAPPFESSENAAFPPPKDINEHVGVSQALQTICSDKLVEKNSQPLWILNDDSGIGREYPARIENGKASIRLPRSICDDLGRGIVTLQIRT
jgi:tetratricopeptide (TPR) repeat protein